MRSQSDHVILQSISMRVKYYVYFLTSSSIEEREQFADIFSFVYNSGCGT